MVSGHEHSGAGRGVARFGSMVSHALQYGLARLGPWSPMVSGHDRNETGRVSRGSGPCSPQSPQGVTRLGPWTRSGFVVSHGLRSWGWAGVTRSGSVIFMVSDHERQGLGGCRALGSVDSRGFSDHERNGAGQVSRGSGPWFPMDSDREQQAWEGVTRWVRGLPDSRERNGAGRVSRDPAPWSPMISDHERHGLRGCGFVGSRTRTIVLMSGDHGNHGPKCVTPSQPLSLRRLWKPWTA